MILDDQLLAALAEFGPQTTGALRVLTSPHIETRRVRHGSWSGQAFTPCPNCECTETVNVDRSAATTVRIALRRLARQGKVIRLDVDQPNNHGGHGWMLSGWPLKVEGELSVLMD